MRKDQTGMSGLREKTRQECLGYAKRPDRNVWVTRENQTKNIWVMRKDQTGMSGLREETRQEYRHTSAQVVWVTRNYKIFNIMPSKTDNSSEMHPHFPSGEWEGFFVYFRGGEQYKMAFHLNFKDGVVTGSGADMVNAFTWKGKYSIEDFTCRMVKSYPTHQVFYDGRADENGIWGLWKMEFFTGGFHIWPKGSGMSEAVEEVELVSEDIAVPT